MEEGLVLCYVITQDPKAHLGGHERGKKEMSQSWQGSRNTSLPSQTGSRVEILNPCFLQSEREEVSAYRDETRCFISIFYF